MGCDHQVDLAPWWPSPFSSASPSWTAATSWCSRWTAAGTLSDGIWERRSGGAHLNRVHSVLALCAENAGLPQGEKRRRLLQESVWTDDVLQVVEPESQKQNSMKKLRMEKKYDFFFCLSQLQFKETNIRDEFHFNLKTQWNNFRSVHISINIPQACLKCLSQASRDHLLSLCLLHPAFWTWTLLKGKIKPKAWVWWLKRGQVSDCS